MKKVTKILSVVLVLALVMTMSVVLFACGDEPNNTPTKTPLETPINFTLKVTEWNGASLLNAQVSLKYVEDTPLTVLKDNADVVENKGFVSRINNNVLFPEWSLCLYVNDELASTGIADLQLKENDVVEFRNEYYPYTFATEEQKAQLETQLKAEKALLQYYLVDMANKYSTLAKIDHYVDLAVVALNNFGANIKYVPSQKMADSFVGKDLTKLAGPDWGKYYWFMKSQGMDMTNYVEAYTNHYNALDSTYDVNAEFSEYTYPFELAPAKALGLSNTAIEEQFVDKSVVMVDNYGYDSSLFTAMGVSQYRTLTETELNAIKALNIDNAYSNGWVLMVLAANNVNDCSALVEKEVAAIEDGSIKGQYGESQVYMGLVANKLAHMTNAAFNIFTL